MVSLADRLQDVYGRIAAAAGRAGRDPAEVRLVAVTKTHPAETIREAVRAGISDIGENKIQEAREKIDALEPGAARFHLIGHLQSNKAKLAVHYFDMIHSIDSVKLALEINRHAAAAGVVQDVLLQVNISGEETKSGFAPQQLREQLGNILESAGSLNCMGLMTMAPFADDPEEARVHFRNLRLLRDELCTQSSKYSRPLGPNLSMGMTNDFEVAIEEGATVVRIGSALFGSRLNP